jgi:antitoxin component YwqK of YwqJK toxin-antitoxin module
LKVMRFLLFLMAILLGKVSFAQDIVPKAKTKAERKAERKQMTLEQKVESVLPVDISGSHITSLEEARKHVGETIPSTIKKRKEKGRKAAANKKKEEVKVFDGKNYRNIAVEKRILKRRSSLLYQEFYVLKNHQDPAPYHRAYAWFDEKNQRISEVLSRDPKTNSLLHGPYREYRGENLIKEGFYYLGVKDGRWMQYDKNFVLLEKEVYKNGFYEESQISYYDNKMVQEVIPMRFGKTSGTYYRYHPDGTVAEEGKYENGKKIGKWVEFYPGGTRRKKEVQYPASFYEESEPFTLVEYDEKGKVTFDKNKP